MVPPKVLSAISSLYQVSIRSWLCLIALLHCFLIGKVLLLSINVIVIHNYTPHLAAPAQSILYTSFSLEN